MRSIVLGGRRWRSAVDPPTQMDPADARRGSSAGRHASADELAALFAAIVMARHATPAATTTPTTPTTPAVYVRGGAVDEDRGVPPANGFPPDLGVRLVDLCHRAHAVVAPGHDGRATTVSTAAIEIDDRELVSVIAMHAPAAVLTSIAELEGYLGRCRPNELALAIAAGCSAGARAIAAITEIERAYRMTIDSTCRRFVNATHTADDLKQILRTRLFVAEPGKQPKIADYAGQGFLENWLRVTAVRIFLDLAKRKDRVREVRAGEHDVLALPQPGDLALDVVKAEYREAVAAAMYEAAKRLEPGDRHLLRQHLVAGLSIDQLGAVLGIHRATAARRITRARERLVADTRAELACRLALDPDELDEVIGLAMSRLDVSLGRLLASDRPRRG
jgi:RNA polymerase sigma-70 factor (ECF subfamily)